MFNSIGVVSQRIAAKEAEPFDCNRRSRRYCVHFCYIFNFNFICCFIRGILSNWICALVCDRTTSPLPMVVVAINHLCVAECTTWMLLQNMSIQFHDCDLIRFSQLEIERQINKAFAHIFFAFNSLVSTISSSYTNTPKLTALVMEKVAEEERSMVILCRFIEFGFSWFHFIWIRVIFCFYFFVFIVIVHHWRRIRAISRAKGRRIRKSHFTTDVQIRIHSLLWPRSMAFQMKYGFIEIICHFQLYAAALR